MLRNARQAGLNPEPVNGYRNTMSHHTPSIDFDLRQLEIFRKVVDLKSFSRAAKEVFRAQASARP